MKVCKRRGRFFLVDENIVDLNAFEEVNKYSMRRTLSPEFRISESRRVWIYDRQQDALVERRFPSARLAIRQLQIEPRYILNDAQFERIDRKFRVSLRGALLDNLLVENDRLPENFIKEVRIADLSKPGVAVLKYKHRLQGTFRLSGCVAIKGDRVFETEVEGIDQDTLIFPYNDNVEIQEV